VCRLYVCVIPLHTRFVCEMQKVQKVGATGSANGSAATGRDRESVELYLPERTSGPLPFEMSTDDDGGTCCNSRQNGIVQPLLTGT